MSYLNESYSSISRNKTLKKSIPTWIMELQGTGNMELNRVVNELHQLNHEVCSTSDNDTAIRTQLTNLYRQVQVIKNRHQEPYRSRLNAVETELAKLRN